MVIVVMGGVGLMHPPSSSRDASGGNVCNNEQRNSLNLICYNCVCVLTELFLAITAIAMIVEQRQHAERNQRNSYN